MMPGFRPEESSEAQMLEQMNLMNDMRQDAAEESVLEGVSRRQMPEGIKELQLVNVPRPNALGGTTVEKGVIHECHPEDQTVTIQFISDQQQLRIHCGSIEPILNLTPHF